MPKTTIKREGLLDSWGRPGNRELPDYICPECGKLFRPLRKKSKYCSHPCHWKNNEGRNKKPETWWTNQKGYIEGRIWLPDGTQISVRKHRFIMEGLLGRPLQPNEDVHHIDGNKSNNDPSNLKLILHGVHSTESNNKRIYRRGYKLNLTEAERRQRSLRAIAQQLYKIGQKSRLSKKLKEVNDENI